jgi:dolichol-phosphate mannosyltransferase
MRIVAVIPTYNERDNIPLLIERLLTVKASLMPDELELLFVDDNSPDGTASVIGESMKRNEFIHLMQREGKQGLGTAYLAGFRHSFENLSPSILVQMDADLQHPPEVIPSLVNENAKGADLVLASRYVKGGGVEGWNWRRVLVSKTANWLARTIVGLHAHDATTGYRAMNRRAVEQLLMSKFSASGFAYQVETIKLIQEKGMKIVEVPFTFKARTLGKSKLSSSEIFKFLRTVIGLRFRKL